MNEPNSTKISSLEFGSFIPLPELYLRFSYFCVTDEDQYSLVSLCSFLFVFFVLAFLLVPHDCDDGSLRVWAYVRPIVLVDYLDLEIEKFKPFLFNMVILLIILNFFAC